MANSAGVFRPSPFPIYATNTRRLALEQTLRIATAFILCCTFIPGIAGPNASLEVPVQSAILQFPERVPATIELCWDTTNAQVAPASLGYIDAEGRLVYSATVARGLVYGQSDNTAWVLEIRAPLDGEVFIDPYLANIREQVVESNTWKNLLLLERQVDLCDGSNPKLDAAWRELAPDLVAKVNPFWAERVLDKYPKLYQEIAARVRDEAKHRARLKELYYGSQQARLAMLVAQFDLQLAMTRYPTHEVEGLAALGDTSIAQATMAEELTRLKGAWETRDASLSKQLAHDRYLLDTMASPDPKWGSNTATPSSGWQGATSLLQGLDTAPQAPTPLQQLETGLIQARMAVSSAELEQIQDGLETLVELEQHVSQGVVSNGGLRNYELPHSKFATLDIEAAKALPDWESILAAKPGRLASLELLASSFFGEEATLGASNAADLEQLGFKPYPNEVALSLWAIDTWTKQGAIPGRDTRGKPGATSQSVSELLGQVIAFPEDYTPESHHLAFLKFADWYSALVKAENTNHRSWSRD